MNVSKAYISSYIIERIFFLAIGLAEKDKNGFKQRIEELLHLYLEVNKQP